MSKVGTNECDSKDIQSYARSLYHYKKKGDMHGATNALKMIRDIANRGIGRLTADRRDVAEQYFEEIF